MARPSTSLDLSEFFSNDDSDGHRLAEFLQKRRGGVQRQNFLFMNCEPQRLSLDVQLEKLPPSQQLATCEKNNEKQIENVEECDKNVENAGNDEIENELASLHGETVGAAPGSNNETNEHVSKVSKVHPLPSEGMSPNSPDKPHRLSPPPSSIKPLSPSRPLSPRLSSIRKSGGISPSDRLRRYSLKRLTKIGRRTLLQEFESTVSDTNFDPPICSTPLSQPLPENLPSSPSSSQSPGVENLIPNGTDKGPSSNESCCEHADTLIRTLQRKDEELKHYMESILENTMRKIQSQEKENNKSTSEDTQTIATSQATKSPLKRTYTVEKGNTLGQVILTPDRTAKQSPPHSRLLRSQTEYSPCKILKTPERSLNRSMSSIKVKSPQNIISPRHLNNSVSYMDSRPNQSNCNITHRGSKMLEISRSRRQQEQQVPTTPPRNNVSIIFPSQDVEIPETQDVPPARENSIIIQSDNREMPLVVIPVNHTFNRTCEKEILRNNTIITARTKQSLNPKNASTKQNEQTAEPSEEQCNQLAEDNLKLTDILTDDDDETPKAAVSRTIENNSQAPLNLAPSATNKRTKRLRKRSISRRRLQMDNSQLLSTETETELNPQAHISRRTVKRKHIPLNRAPGTPLNGEKFAQELARMSNYEILDLRKRNSLGRVFAISGRKSVRSHEEAVKKQNELDDQIEIELLKRNLDEATDKQHSLNDQANIGEDIDECLPAPDEFRDSLDNRQKTKNKSKDSSLIDEKSTDRISFKRKKRNSLEKSRSSKSNKKPIPDVLKQYLEVSKMLTQKKKNKNRINTSKRSLYTQGNSDTEETNSSPEKSELEKNRSSFRNKKKSIPYVPSPPRSDVDEITTLKVVSPPPPLNITPRKSLPQSHQQTTAVDVEENSYNSNTTTNEALPPPPPGFESDSGVSSNHYNIHSNTNNTLQTDQVNTINQTPQLTTNNNSHTDNDDDQIFKKPLQTAPKRRGRPNNVSKIPSNNLVQSTSDSQESADNSADATDGSLRRSKRGQVPLKHPIPIFQLLFQQTFNRRMEMIEKKKQKDKQKSRELSKANKLKNVKDKDSIPSTKTSQPGRTRLPTVPENEPYITSLHQDIEILTKKKTTKVKESKVKRKQNKNNNNNNEDIQPHDNFECSRIIMNTPPPVDHLNNVFDQLRNTSSTLNTSPPTPQPSSSRDLVEKVKPFKVRVARIKSTAQPSGYDNVGVTSTNNNNSNYELISWLKNISESDSSVARNGENEEIFKEMRISAASNLSFTELQGVEYAFYDTDEKASLGYLRFKPRQIKPKKKAKRFHLHFVTLVGNFRITANDKDSRIGVGDMVAIEKSVYYDIENITDDIGILMVIKK
ncbi:rho GTPase-activating protein gacF [Calliphora vicina]|uniref:rho GTPase-activating protein gacF n=1 Tax=Calliphora vicina TaxID=7373 RepID=UPI00325AE47E